MIESLLIVISVLLAGGTVCFCRKLHTNNEIEKIHQRVKKIVFQYDVYDTGELMVELKLNGIRASWIPPYLQALHQQEVIAFKNKQVFKVINRKEKLY